MNDYSVSVQHGESGTVYTIVRLYGNPHGAGWEPVDSFRIGDVFRSQISHRRCQIVEVCGSGRHAAPLAQWLDTDLVPYPVHIPLASLLRMHKEPCQCELCRTERAATEAVKGGVA